jgi:protein tyrosine/serine phosphatase
MKRFQAVIPGVLYRGSAPDINEVKHLKKKFNINKIVSLDQTTGDRIDTICKLLQIKHIKMYIDMNKKSLIHFLSQDLKELFLEDGPTFVHCLEGKDRTGLACALVECKFLGISPEQAIKKAKSLGFGIGMNPELVALYEKIIRSCKQKDNNSSNDQTAVSMEREYIGDNRDSFLDEAHQGSFAPYLDSSRIFPYDITYNPVNDQVGTRENYDDNGELYKSDQKDVTPVVGLYNNDAGIMGAGPSINAGGFIYD